jgi:flagellar biosynthesis protein FlhA
MDIVGEQNMFLIENIIPDFTTVAELRYLLVSLLREEISIKDIVFIFEKINDFADEASKEDLFDKIRLSLSRYISKKFSNDDGVIQALEISDKTYAKLFSNLESDSDIVRVEGDKITKISNALIKKAKLNSVDIDKIILIVPLAVRHIAFMILSQFIPSIKVLAREEISNDYTIEILDEI